MTIESPFVFYPRHAWETLKKVWGHLRVYRQLKAVPNDVLAAPTAGPTATLRLIRVRSACALPPDHRRRAALSRKRRDNAIRAGHDTSPVARSHATEATVAKWQNGRPLATLSIPSSRELFGRRQRRSFLRLDRGFGRVLLAFLKDKRIAFGGNLA